MKRLRNSIVAAVALTLAASLAACTGSSTGGGGGSTDTGVNSSTPPATTNSSAPGGTSSSPSAASSNFSVGLELTGAKNDGGYDQAIYSGLLDAQKKFGIKVQVAEEKTSLSDQTSAVSTLAQNNNLVFIVSFIGDAATAIAKQNPKTNFFVVDGDLDPSVPNLHAFRTNQGLAAYVAGVVSAKITKSNIVGYVGASQIPATTGSYIGFKMGIASVDPKAKVLKTYTGSFVDSSAAKEATSAQIAQGADVIYTFLDSATDGAFAAVQASNKPVKIFNITTNRCSDGSFVAGSDIVSPTAFISNLIGDAKDGKYPTDKPVIDLSNPADQMLQMCPPFKSLQTTADSVTKSINDGSVKLPATVV